MSKKIQLTPSELLSQANEMDAIVNDMTQLFSSVTSELRLINSNWSLNLSNNFAGKITSTKKTFAELLDTISEGSAIAKTSATTFASIDSELAKVYSSNEEKSTSLSDDLKDSVIDYFQNIPEEIKTVGENMAWLEKYYNTWPKTITKLFDVLLPGSLKDSIKFTSHIYQGTLTPEELWDFLKHMLSARPELAMICAALEFAAGEGVEISAEMEDRINQRIAEGDITGAVLELISSVKKLPTGLINVTGNILKNFVDSFIKKRCPGGEYINSAFEYFSAIFGENDGEGYSFGDLFKETFEKASEIYDSTVDSTTKYGIGIVKSWFD